MCDNTRVIKGIVWADSADRHDVDRDDALNAIINADHHEAKFDEPRVPGGIRPDLYIGPSRNHIPGDPLLEVMLERHPTDFFIFHAMEARPKMLDRVNR